MKNEILKLRSEGLSYTAIAEKLKCAKSTVAYYCNNTTKDKANSLRKHRLRTNISTILDAKLRRIMVRRGNDFKRRGIGRDRLKVAEKTFTTDELVEFALNNQYCYLTGKPIDLYSKSSYHLDHIVPLDKGGTNTLDNLGLASKEANIAKQDMTVKEFLSFCIDVLEFNGYAVLPIE